jgi:predicted transposase/invertase (TIGR01784 family)
METDSFFCQLFKQLPQTLFELIGQPSERARSYHFDSVEIKKSLRIDGLFLPKEPDLPVYFVEVQFHRPAAFYANLFAKVFLFLQANDAARDWAAVAIFESRRFEPKHLEPYEDLLRSKPVTRIYLDEYRMPDDPPLGLGILQLVSAPESEVKELVTRLMQKTEREFADSEMGRTVIELMEELLIRRFSELKREEIRKMFHLADIRKTAVWKEAHEEGVEEGVEKGIEKGIEKGETRTKKELVGKWLAKGRSVKEIAELMEIPVKEVRRFAKDSAK